MKTDTVATLPSLRHSVHPFELTPLTVFLYSGRECVVQTVKPIMFHGEQSGVVIRTNCGKTITFRRNSPNVQIVL